MAQRAESEHVLLCFNCSYIEPQGTPHGPDGCTSTNWRRVPLTESMVRHGWRGISAPVEFAAKGFGTGWLAVATGVGSGDIAVAVWTGETWAEREFAFWMEHDAARKLIAALQEELGHE